MKRILLYSLFLCISLNLLSMENQISPLHQAVLNNDLNAVKKLVDEGADIKGKDSNGKTAFDYAVTQKAYKKIAAYLYPFYYDLEALENIIGYKFKKVEKIVKAFTPRRVCSDRNYEVFEWFGDAILHEVLTVILDDQRYENANEGELTCARQALEQKETLAELSKRLGFDKYIIKHSGELIAIDMLEDVVESLIAAIYKDGGPVLTQKFINRYWLPMLKNSNKAPASPITVLESIEKLEELKEFTRDSKNLSECKLIYGDLEIIGYCSKDECGGKKMKRIAKYRAARKFIEALPGEFDKFKKMILISPLSREYQIGSDEPEYILDTKRWESNLPSKFSYKINMLSQMLYDNNKDKFPKCDTVKMGKDHDPIFISTLACSWLNGKLTGAPAKTKKVAEENVAKLAYYEWTKQALDGSCDIIIDPRKLVFIESIKKQMSTAGGKNSQQLLLELTQQLGKVKPCYNDYLVGGKIGDPFTGQFYSTVECSDITQEVITGEKCASISKAQKSAASAMLNIIIQKLTKSK